MRHLTFLPLLLGVSLLRAQTSKSAQTPPLLSPQAAYDQASTPVDIIHRSRDNWSDIERAALQVAVAQARDACLARTAITYSGDDLIAYARLCDLGEQWKVVYTASTTYINTKDVAKPQLEQAYAFEVLADLNLHEWKAASQTCFAMLNSVPYGPLTDGITTMAVNYLQFAYLPDALDILAQRQRKILNLLSASQAVPAPSQPPPIPLHTLFEHALNFAALQQYNDQPKLATAVLNDIDEAMPASISPDEAIVIAADRRQYALLGTHFPLLPGAVSLLPAAGMPPTQPRLGAATIFLLFPPWCAQCVRQAQQIVSALVGAAILRGSDNELHVYALLADTPAQSIKPTPSARPHQPASSTSKVPIRAEVPDGPLTAQDQLRKTPTLVVAPSTLADFHAIDFPFLIATDHDGIIRLMIPAAPDNALLQGGPVEQIADTILSHWPPPK